MHQEELFKGWRGVAPVALTTLLLGTGGLLERVNPAPVARRRLIMNPNDELVSEQFVLNWLGITKKALDQLRYQKGFLYYRLGRSHRVCHRSETHEWIKSNCK